MNTPLIGQVKIALKQANLGISKEIVSEDGDLSLFLFAGDDDSMFVSATFDDTDDIALVKAGPILLSDVAQTRNAACAVAWMRQSLESLPRGQRMRTLDDGELLDLARKRVKGKRRHATRI
jgi:hypothetical protein